MRGLKLKRNLVETNRQIVAPYTGAWIEIILKHCVILGTGRTLHGCVDWNRYFWCRSNFNNVAPYTGAWIEIFRLSGYTEPVRVAPYTGAWIEIGWFRQRVNIWQVAPYTGAWIEIRYLHDTNLPLKVAPYTGAWIEILVFRERMSGNVSHPTRVRGLKFYTIYVGYLILTSHPTRVRGLKSLDRALSAARCPVAPYTGAWIEIWAFWLALKITSGRTLHGCVDWNY